ncbi:hypothetical protein QTO34_003958 [Cnephaeus nilssonii]|uniref:Uncharacterized protein n=1 Tax=Cnephaeus nilssonii TaxID=3371016 RepID=A0AA40HSE7_CNENI|nr:hypothetical protein QTO34_003958 [Eptesicus nilssonii]
MAKSSGHQPVVREVRKLYTTSLATLTSFPDSMLGAMFSRKMPNKRDSQGNSFVTPVSPTFLNSHNSRYPLAIFY